MTSARFHPFCKKHKIIIGCYDGFTVCPRNITESNIAIYKYKKHFCLVWKANAFSFNKARNELKLNFKVHEKATCDKHVKSFIKIEYNSKKVQSQLTKVVVYDLETFNTDKVVPYSNFVNELSKLSSNYSRDITQREYEKCKEDCIVFKATDSINEMLEPVL